MSSFQLAARGCGVERSRRKRALFVHGVATVVLIGGAAAFAAIKDIAPVISGTPATSVLATKSYFFAPRASDANRDKLTFLIKNRPSWASFDARSGRLYGTPARSNSGVYKNVTISVSDGKLSAALRPFNISVVGLINRPPTLSGTPSNTVTVGQRYLFVPTATDADGNKMVFRVANKPSWLSFDATTGRLIGVPTAANVGTYGNIVLSASDGSSTGALRAFSIKVVGPAEAVRAAVVTSSGSVSVDWVPPTENTDASTLTDLAGYRLYYGDTPKTLNHVVQITNPGLSRYVLDNLSAGVWYFALSAYNRKGRESDRSGVINTEVR